MNNVLEEILICLFIYFVRMDTSQGRLDIFSN